MTSSKIFLYFCLSFIGGIFLNSFFNFSQPILISFLILGILLISVFWPYKKLVVVGFCILFLVAGIWRHQQALSKIVYPKEKAITFVGQIIQEPDVRDDNIKLTVKAENIEGKILVTAHRYPEYRYGDKLRMTGKLKIPQTMEDFNYPGYLAKEGIYSVMSWPEIELLEKNQGNPVFANILSFKNKLRESVYQNLLPPQSSILGAMILGDKRKISQEWKNKLNYAGVRHITAISGLHVTILTSILMTILIGLGLWRQQAFWFSIVLIILFIIMTGLQPSAIRAGIMGGLFLLAQYLGRMKVSSRAIVFAAAIMLAINPLLLKLDVGFQLSFLAMIGIIYLLPIFRAWFTPLDSKHLTGFKKIPNYFKKLLSPARDVLAMTLSAQIFTLPILIYNFGYFSQVAPITNVLVVPLLPYIMGLGFIFGLIGMIFQPLGWILSWPCWLLLTYLTKVVDWFSSFSWASLTLEISWIWLAISYLILGLITWRLNEKQKLKFLEY